MSAEPQPKVLQLRPDLHAAAIELLHVHRDHMARERRTRLALIHAARRAGMTHRAIGEALGYSESGIRHMLKDQDPT